jgi:hypothetical protein
VRPDPPLVIRRALKTLEAIAAGRTDTQEISGIRGVMNLLSMLENEWDVCASSRMDRILRYREIIHRGSSWLDEDDRQEELMPALAAADLGEVDLRISSLEMALDTLRTAVGSLQGWLEESDDPTGRALLVDIWRAEYADAVADDRNHPFW